ncbi:MAG: dipeptidase PepE [Flavobacterium sp.]|nr:dipeptidase PepE [Flavobacterium sp.]
MKNLIVASTSTLHESGYLEYLLSDLQKLFEGCDEILFVPYARPSGITHAEYTAKVAGAFQKIDKKVKGIHDFDNPETAIKGASGIFIGGGNTFLLVSQLYKFGLIDVLKTVVERGTPYLGCSAGSNITGQTMQTTNDMPIIYPPSFDTLGFLPFNLNPHYLDPDPNSTHMGETRETRIKEYHAFNQTPVIGLREGSWLRVIGDQILLQGKLTARVFRSGESASEVDPGSDLSNIQA